MGQILVSPARRSMESRWVVDRPAQVTAAALATAPICRYPGGRLSQVAGDGVRIDRCRFRVAAVDENASATSPMAGLHITPPVPHHDASRKVEVPVACGLEQHPGSRFPAFASICIVMRAEVDSADRQGPQEVAGTRRQRPCPAPLGRCPVGSSRREGRTQIDEVPAQASSTSGKMLNSSRLRRRMWPAIPDDGPVEHAIPIQEHSHWSVRGIRPSPQLSSARPSSSMETERCSERLPRIHGVEPAELAYPLGVQPNDRDVTLPSPVAATKVVPRLRGVLLQDLETQISDLSHGDVVTGGNVECAIGLRTQLGCREDSAHDVT